MILPIEQQRQQISKYTTMGIVTPVCCLSCCDLYISKIISFAESFPSGNALTIFAHRPVPLAQGEEREWNINN